MSVELEGRTFMFADKVRKFCRKLKWDSINLEDIKQLVRASGSVGANYIEANESLGDADRKMRIKISRKEAKESAYWLKLLDMNDRTELEKERRLLLDEAEQLRKIFSAILKKF